MRTLLMSSALALVASAAFSDVALVLGTDRYDTLDRLRRGEEPVDATNGLSELGFDILRIGDGTTVQVQRALDGFVNRVPQSERIVVTLSGRFVTDGDRTWYLTTQAERPSYLTLDETAVSVDSIMQAMSRSPGSALLFLAYDASEDEVFDPWLAEGVGTLDIPQGVTVLFGGPRAVARFMEDELVEPGGDLARLVAANENISAAGYLPRRMIFIGDDAGSVAQVIVPQVPNDAAERALWSGALALDRVTAYRNYLDRYPNGQFAEEARDRIEAIVSEPYRGERLTEEALQLTRAQRRGIQENLNILNFNTRGVDGIFGPGTRNAITNWQQQNGFPQSSYLDGEQINRLLSQAQQRQQELAEEAARLEQEARRAENAHWEATGALGTVAGLQAYLDRYPDGRYAGIAQDRIAAQQQTAAEIAAQQDLEARRAENAHWQVTGALGTIAGLQGYLDRYPNGRYAGIAQQRIEEQLEDDDRTLARTEENAVWSNMLLLDDVRAYENYLRLYPNGRYASDAQSRIFALQNGEQRLAPDGMVLEEVLRAPDGMIIDGNAQLEAQERGLGLSNLTARLVENHLQGLGMNPGPVDGVFDDQARQAIRRYQNENGLQVTGYLDERTAAQLIREAQ